MNRGRRPIPRDQIFEASFMLPIIIIPKHFGLGILVEIFSLRGK
jgi:hypothetical protein